MEKITLIGGLDSFGVPYTRDNKEHKSHLTYVYEYYKQKGYDVEVIDMYAMSDPYNDTDYLNNLLSGNKITINKIHQNQQESISLCRKKGPFQYIQLPKRTTKLYSNLNINIKEKTLKEIIKSNNKIIFIYSCGINDFLKMIGKDLGKLLNPKTLDEVTKDINIKLDKVITKIKTNFDKLLELNPSIQIYVLGIPVTTRVNYIRKRITNPIKIYNSKLLELCNEYFQIHYVDNSKLTKKHMAHIDWHPNKYGQEEIGKNIINEMRKLSKR